MQIYIIQRVNHLTDSYHNEGGLAIVANDRDHAGQLFAEYAKRVEDSNNWSDEIYVTDAEWQTAKVYELAQDAEPAVFVFPDAGCC